MSYKRQRYRYGNFIEVKEFHTARYGAPGMPRQKKEKPTPEAVRKQNQKRKEEKAGRIVWANFGEGDYVRTLTFARDKRPADMKEAQDVFKTFYQALRKEYRKRFYDLMWIANIECSQRGAWHIHFICNKIFGGGDLIKELWQHGGVYDQILRDMTAKGQDIGKYISKTPDSTEEAGEHKVKESKQTHSRNLKIPEPEEKVIGGWKLTDEPRPPKGYYLVKDSLYEGINSEGYRYRSYRFARIQPRPPKAKRWKPPAKKAKKRMVRRC